MTDGGFAENFADRSEGLRSDMVLEEGSAARKNRTHLLTSSDLWVKLTSKTQYGPITEKSRVVSTEKTETSDERHPMRDVKLTASAAPVCQTICPREERKCFFNDDFVIFARIHTV